MAVERQRLTNFLKRISGMKKQRGDSSYQEPPFSKRELTKRLREALPERQKPTFEALEPRFLLSADLMPQVDTALLDGLEEFKAWTATLDEVSELNQALPLVDMSILDALDVPSLVQTNLINPLSDYFNSLNVGELGTTDGVVSALAHLPSASGDLVGNAFIFDVDFDVSSDATANLNLGQEADDLGFQLLGAAEADVIGGVDLQFSFGVDVSDGVVDVTDFFLSGDDLSLSLSDADTPVAFPLRYNFVDSEVEDGDLELDARAVLDIEELDADNSGRVTVAELQAKSAGELTGLSVGGDANLFLPLEVSSLPFATTGNPEVTIGTPDVFAGLEPGVSVNGDFDTLDVFNADIRAALNQGFSGLQIALGETAGTGLLAENLFPVDGSLNDFLHIEEILDQHLSSVVAQYFSDNAVANVDSLVAALNQQTGIYANLGLNLVASGAVADDVLTLDISLSATRTDADTSIDLGLNVADFLTTEENLVADVVSTFAWDFSISLDLNQVISPTTAIRFDLSDVANASLGFSIDQPAFEALAGFLALDVGTVGGIDSIVDFQANVALDFDFSEATLNELEEQPAAERTMQSGSADVNYNLRATSSIAGAASDPSNPAVLSFVDNLYDQNNGVLTENFTALGITDFNNANGSTVRSSLNSLREFFQSYLNSAVFNDTVPLTESLLLGDVLVQGTDGELDELTDLLDLIDSQLVGPLTTLAEGEEDVEIPSFESIQGMIDVLGGVIGNVSFDAASNRLNFDLSLGGELTAVTTEMALGDLGALSGLQTDSSIEAIADASITLSLGLLLTPIGSNIGTLSESTLVKNLNAGRGVLTVEGFNDLEIRLSDGRTAEVDLDFDAETGTLGDIMVAIQTAADLAFGADVFFIGINETEDGLVLIDRSGGDQPFEVRGINDSLAYFGLGLGGASGKEDIPGETTLFINGAPLHGDTMSRHLIVDDATIDTSLALNAASIEATGQWGDLDVEISSGTGSASLQSLLSLAEAPGDSADGVTTLNDLITGLNSPFALIENETEVSSFDLDLPITPVGDFISTAGFAPVYSVTAPDAFDAGTFVYSLANSAGSIDSLLRAVEFIEVSTLIDGMREVSVYLETLANQRQLLSETLPGLDQSVGELFDFAAQFDTAIDELQNAGSPSLQAFKAALDNLTGVSGLSIELDQTPGREAIRLDFGFDFTDLNAAIPLHLDLTTLGIDLVALGLDPVGMVVDTNGASPINVSGSGALALSLGFDVATPDMPNVYFGDTTRLDFDLFAEQQSINFEALFGAIAVNIAGGKFALDADGAGNGTDAVNYAFSFSPTAGGRYEIANAAALTNVLLDSGALSVDLPLIFPAEIPAPQPNLVVTVGDLNDIPGTTSLSGPDVTNLLSSFSVIDNLDSFRVGWDDLWASLDTLINDAVLSRPLPILGTQLAGTIDFVSQIREKVSDNLSLLTDTLTANDIQQALFDAFGPGGLNWLQTGSGGAPSLDDVVVSIDAQEVLFDFALAMPVTQLTDIDIDLGLPGLGLDINSLAEASVSIDLPLTVGISNADGVFIDAATLNEMMINFDADMSGIDDTDGQLGFLPVTVNNAPGSNNILSGGYAIDFVAGDGRLSRNDLMGASADSVLAVSPTGGANLDLIINTNFPEGTVMSDYQLALDIDWDLATDTVEIEFTDISIDLVSLLKDFALPQLERIQASWGPIRPLLEFLGAGPPLLSEIFSLRNWGDLATLFNGANNTFEFVAAVDVIDELVDGERDALSLVTNALGDAVVTLGSEDIVGLGDLTGEAWISIGSMTIDSNVARGLEEASTADDLIAESNARPFLPVEDEKLVVTRASRHQC